MSSSANSTTLSADQMIYCGKSIGYRFMLESGYKVALLCFTCYKLGSPTFLSSLLEKYKPTCSLRSSSRTCCLFRDQGSKPQRATFLRLHLMFGTPFRLLSELLPTSVGSFQSHLKIHLYRLSFE